MQDATLKTPIYVVKISSVGTVKGEKTSALGRRKLWHGKRRGSDYEPEKIVEHRLLRQEVVDGRQSYWATKLPLIFYDVIHSWSEKSTWKIVFSTNPCKNKHTRSYKDIREKITKSHNS